MEAFEDVKLSYEEYVNTFRTPSGELPPMMELKYVHTLNVIKNSLLIAQGEGLGADERARAQTAALLHDVGRYEQLRVYNTFRDSESVDHATFSHDIVFRHGWCRDEIVLKAVLYHNRRELPPDLDENTLCICRVLRDADKLDIFNVLEDRVKNTPWRQDATAFWSLKIDAAPSCEVMEALRGGRAVDYQHIKSLADFVLVQLGWMISGLHFATSRRLCRERGHLDFRRWFLGELGAASQAQEVFELAQRGLDLPPAAQ